MIKDDRRDFNKEAALWDENPTRVKLATDISQSVFDEVELTGEENVLDFGCGTGLLTFFIQPRVRSITCVDSAPNMLAMLENRAKRLTANNVITKCLDVENGDLMVGSYQLVVSSMAIHHIKNSRLLFGQLFNIIAPGGVLCIADLDTEDGKFHEDSTGVFHNGFNREELVMLLHDVGFTGIKHKTAATVSKPIAGEMRQFTIFLISARKRDGG